MGHDNGYWDQGLHGAHSDWWAGPFHLLVFLLIVALLVAAGVWLAGRLSRGRLVLAPAHPAVAPLPPAASDPAVAALRMRYASGGVSREEFQQAMDDLTSRPVPPPGDAAGTGEAPTAS